MQKVTRIEYMCTHCGTKTTMLVTMGRPNPGNCPRKPRTASGQCRPHTWVINRKY